MRPDRLPHSRPPPPARRAHSPAQHATRQTQPPGRPDQRPRRSPPDQAQPQPSPRRTKHHRASISRRATSASTTPVSSLLPKQASPNRAPSSSINATTPIGRTGRNPRSRSKSRARKADTTPSGPSNAPPSGTESRWLPVTTPPDARSSSPMPPDLRGRHDRGARRCASSRRHDVPPPPPKPGFPRHPTKPRDCRPHHIQPAGIFLRGLEKPLPATRVRFGKRVPPIAAGRRIPAERQQRLPERHWSQVIRALTLHRDADAALGGDLVGAGVAGVDVPDHSHARVVREHAFELGRRPARCRRRRRPGRRGSSGRCRRRRRGESRPSWPPTPC